MPKTRTLNEKMPITTNQARSLGQWVYWPDQLQNGRFRGFENRDDSSQLRGAWVAGQNISFLKTSLPTLRKGFEPIGTEATDTTKVNRAWIFERRNGDRYELKAYSTGVYYWLQGTSTEYALLKGSFTTSLEFCFANIGEAGTTEHHTFFCNGTENWFQFNGAHGVVSSTTSSTIVFTTTIAAIGFYTTGTRSVTIGGSEYAYTGQSGSTLTGVTPDPSAAGVVANNLAVQTPREVTAMSSFLARIAMAHDGRIHGRLQARQSVWNYSKLDDPDDWTTGSTDGDGGTKEIEFSGAITAFAKLNKSILCFKKRIIKMLQFVQSGTRLDVPFYQTIVQSDDKSTTLGTLNQRSICSTPYGLAFVTPDKRLMLLTGVTANNEPQFVCLSDPIQPIFNRGKHDDASLICSDYTLFYSYKETVSSGNNDTVLIGDMTKQAFDSNGRVLPIQWDTPVIGWNVQDWTILENNDLDSEVHWHSSINSNSYRVITSKVDNTGSFSAAVRSWAEHFDLPMKQKKVDMLMVEVRMKEITNLLVTIFYDDDGFSGKEEYILDGDSIANRYRVEEYNPFGFSAFGRRKIGGNVELDDAPIYRFFIELPANIYFHNISTQFSIAGEGMDFEVIRFGYRLKEVLDTPPRSLKVGVS